MTTTNTYPSDAQIAAVHNAIEDAVRQIGTWTSRAQRDMAYAAALKILADAMAREMTASHLQEFRAESLDSKRAHLRDVHQQLREGCARSSGSRGSRRPAQRADCRSRERCRMTTADLYLRLSDFRADDADSFPAREAKLRAKAADLGWTVHEPPIIENDLTEDGSRKPASAYKRQRVTGPDGRPLMRHGRPVYRVLRPGWQQVLDQTSGPARPPPCSPKTSTG